MSDSDRLDASAWACWWAGFQVGQHLYFLWWSIAAWGRFGKFLQFVSGAFILLEMVGPDKLDAASQSIAAWPTPLRSVNVPLHKIGSWALAFVKAVPKLILLLSLVLMPLGLWALLVGVGALSAPNFASAMDRTLLVLSGDSLASIVVVFIALVVAAIFTLLLAYSIVIGLLTMIVAGLSTLLSYLVGHPKLKPRAKVGSWAVFVLGFWLDFLAS